MNAIVLIALKRRYTFVVLAGAGGYVQQAADQAGERRRGDGGDVAHVYLGGPPQTNAVLVHGQQAVLLEVLKAGNAATLAVVAGVKAQIPKILQTLPAGVKITPRRRSREKLTCALATECDSHFLLEDIGAEVAHALQERFGHFKSLGDQ